jgi:ribosomal protein L17
MKKYSRFQNSYLGVNTSITKDWLKNYYDDLVKCENISNTQTHNSEVPTKYKLLVETASKAIVLQDNKKKLGLIAYIIMENWLRDISVKTKILFEDLCWLTVEEILSYNLNSKTDLDKIVKRIEKYKRNGERL